MHVAEAHRILAVAVPYMREASISPLCYFVLRENGVQVFSFASLPVECVIFKQVARRADLKGLTFRRSTAAGCICSRSSIVLRVVRVCTGDNGPPMMLRGASEVTWFWTDRMSLRRSMFIRRDENVVVVVGCTEYVY